MFKKRIIIVLCLGFMCINFFNIVGFFQNFFGNFYFYTHQYSKAKDLFKKEKTSIGDFNLANALYKEGSFSEALKTYIALLGKEKTYLNFALNYNIGNTYYRLSEQKKDSKENQGFLEKALSHYNEALKIKSDWQTQKNIDFIKEKMKNIHQESQNAGEKQNSENVSQNNQNTNNQTKETQDENQKTGNSSANQNGNKNTTGYNGEKSAKEEQQAKQGTSNVISEQNNKELSQDEKQKIAEYEKFLQDAQKQNQSSFGKVYQESLGSSMDDFFSGNPFFDNSFLHQKSDVKDW